MTKYRYIRHLEDLCNDMGLKLVVEKPIIQVVNQKLETVIILTEFMQMSSYTIPFAELPNGNNKMRLFDMMCRLSMMEIEDRFGEM